MSGALNAALSIAAQGFPVFPCGKNKRPAIPTDRGGHGFLDAVRDEGAVRELFAKAPNAALAGSPTGEISGFDVLDLDYRHGAHEWEDTNLHRLPETRIHRSQSGGRHYLFRHAPGVRNNASKVAPGIDVRGDGGYVILPPSDNYEIEHEADIADWPDWLLELVLARPPERINGHDHHPPIESRRLEGLLRAITDRLQTAPEGAKHFQLRNAALSVGGIQQAAGLSDARATEMLLHTVPGTVRDWGNAEKTIAWGLAQGRARPIELEDRPQYARTQAEPPQQQEDPPSTDTDHATIFQVEFFHDIKVVLDARDFVEGVLMSGAMSVIYGGSASGKTFYATDLGLHVACGWEWNGRAVEQGGVIYLAFEGAFGIRNRIVAFREEHGIGSYDIPFAIIPVTMDLLDPAADTSKLIRTIKHVAAGLTVPVRWVVGDTLSRAMAGGNENAPDDMGALVTNGTRIQQETGAAMGWVHHSGKDQARGARGHSLLRAATDTEIEVVVEEDGQRTARVTKQREMECVGEWAFRLKPVELGTNARGKPVSSCIVDYGGKPAVRRGRAAGGPGGHPQRALEILTDLCAGSGKSGYQGMPDGMLSVPGSWWRERFYDRAMPGDKQDTKKHAFDRASTTLINRHLVGMAGERVWVVQPLPETTPERSS